MKKLLALDLIMMNAKMLEVCPNHIGTADNLSTLGLKGSIFVNAILETNPSTMSLPTTAMEAT